MKEAVKPPFAAVAAILAAVPKIVAFVPEDSAAALRQPAAGDGLPLWETAVFRPRIDDEHGGDDDQMQKRARML